MSTLERICKWSLAFGLLAVALALLASKGLLPGDMLISGPASVGSPDPFTLSPIGLWFFGGGVLLSLFSALAWAWVRAKLLDAEEFQD